MSHGFFDDGIKSKRCNIRLSNREFEAWRAYCIKHGTRISQVLREFMNGKIIAEEGVRFYQDPNYAAKARIADLETELIELRKDDVVE